MNPFEVYIQSEKNSRFRLRVDETSLEIHAHDELPLPHPWAYGFVLNTRAADGDCLDCFVITNQVLKAGSIVPCQAVALLQMWENQEADHKILAVPVGEMMELPDPVPTVIQLFLRQCFKAFPQIDLRFGDIHPASGIKVIDSHE